MAPLGPGCGIVSNRLQAADTFTREIRAMRSATATKRRLPRNGEPLGIGRIVNHQRQEWTELRRDWNRDATAMLAAAQVDVVLRGGEILEKFSRNNGLRGSLTWIACFT